MPSKRRLLTHKNILAALAVTRIPVATLIIQRKIEVMTTSEWLDCELLESVPGKVSGAVVFKNSRLPVATIVENVDAFMEIEGLSEAAAVEATLECFPSVPGGADGIRAVLAYRELHERQLQP